MKLLLSLRTLSENWHLQVNFYCKLGGLGGPGGPGGPEDMIEYKVVVVTLVTAGNF